LSFVVQICPDSREHAAPVCPHPHNKEAEPQDGERGWRQLPASEQRHCFEFPLIEMQVFPNPTAIQFVSSLQLVHAPPEHTACIGEQSRFAAHETHAPSAPPSQTLDWH
jgi:hypothetical protein